MKKIQFKKYIAFSLVEVALLLAIAGAIIAGSLTLLGPPKKFDQYPHKVTLERMKLIEDRLALFVAEHKRLPCPANPHYPIDALSDYSGSGTNTKKMFYGDENIHIKNNVIACDFIPKTGEAVNSIGAVPTKALGLPTEYMFDGWNRKIRYHLSRNICSAETTNDGEYCSSKKYIENEGNLVVKTTFDAISNITDIAAYVLLSFGPKGYEAYDKNGTLKTDNNANPDEAENIDYDNIYVLRNYQPVYDGTDLREFNHYVAFKTKEQISNTHGFGKLFSRAFCQQVIINDIGYNFNKSQFERKRNYNDYGANSLNNHDYWEAYNSSGAYTSIPDPFENYYWYQRNTVRQGDHIFEMYWALMNACHAHYGDQITRFCPNALNVPWINNIDFPCRCNNANWSGSC